MINFGALVKNQRMAKKKYRDTRSGVFFRTKLYKWYAERRKMHYDTVDRTFYDAINFNLTEVFK